MEKEDCSSGLSDESKAISEEVTDRQSADMDVTICHNVGLLGVSPVSADKLVEKKRNWSMYVSVCVRMFE